jgi:hypothetical protein
MSVIERVNRALGSLTFCPTGKVAYQSSEHAGLAAARQTTKHTYLRAYKCEKCGWWHLTKQRRH